MKTDDATVYTIVPTKQKFIADTFPLYTLCLGFGMYAMHYIVVLFIGFFDPSLELERIIWLGTYVTPYLFHFWVLAAFFILGFLFFRDYRKGFRQIKLERYQITLYPKQKSEALQIFSWEYPIQTVLLPKGNTLFKIDLENRSLSLPANTDPSAIVKITQFYHTPLVNEDEGTFNK
ncbi:MAG: Unknown protein [uncultured Aureispira sp.]|uniref:Uncharacterized protein n=1 Tax=uncultured Aureispira sp. TaxID=1331704 RepID=A0A6S6UGL2_9BACT|nr:MAG: Unknown protein [uncultured Aureispira sp.]